MLRVLYTVLGAVVGVLALRTYEVTARAKLIENNAAHSAAMSHTYHLLVDRCMATLDRCKTVVEDSNHKYDLLNDQYDKLTQTCYISNTKTKPKLVQNVASQSLEGSGGPFEK